ncbi:MAG TPA: response regulator [Rhodocyclaceae bacterium]|nr:response regulator [Rhodocyclaceae bacterium]
MRKAFAKALRKMRKAQGLTQEDFALVSSRTYLSSLERGKKSPTLDKVCDLAKIIGVHPLSLLTLTCLYFEHEDTDNLDSLVARIKSEIDLPRLESPVIRILITDDHAMVREGLKQLFSFVDDIEVVGEAGDGARALELLARGGIDVLLLDLNMPGLCGKELVSAIRSRYPDLPILVLTMNIEQQVAHGALKAGANGYLSKDQEPETLIEAVRTVAAGGLFIDPRHSEALADRFAPACN